MTDAPETATPESSEDQASPEITEAVNQASGPEDVELGDSRLLGGPTQDDLNPAFAAPKEDDEDSETPTEETPAAPVEETPVEEAPEPTPEPTPEAPVEETPVEAPVEPTPEETPAEPTPEETPEAAPAETPAEPAEESK